MKKIYIVRKYVYAKDIKEALKLEKTTPVHEAFLEANAVDDLKYTLDGKTVEERTGFRGK